MIEVEELGLGQAKIIRTRRFHDVRGWFSESFSECWLADAGIAERFVQDNLSWSEKAGTLRGSTRAATANGTSKARKCGGWRDFRRV